MASRNLLPWFSALAFAAACSPAYADRVAPEAVAHKVVVPDPQPVLSPYQVDLIGEDGRSLSTYQHNGRYYIMGSVGARYSIMVTNPTDRRVEAVLSVDGLDVIDGQTADFVNKRGYVVPAHGQLKVDGFRVSTSHVATFRFSAVANSYAGRKGQARNVGVIGVAIFEERPQPEVVVMTGAVDKPTPRDYYWDEGDDDSIDYELDARFGESTKDEPAAAPPPAPTGGSAGSRGHADRKVGANQGAPAPDSTRYRETAEERECCGAKPKKRPGLGTEFGERRQSAVSFTRFERANATTPNAMAELRYNDRDGLVALGIRLDPPVDREEISTRETADPFPNSHGYSAPPPGWR